MSSCCCTSRFEIGCVNKCEDITVGTVTTLEPTIWVWLSPHHNNFIIKKEIPAPIGGIIVMDSSLFDDWINEDAHYDIWITEDGGNGAEHLTITNGTSETDCVTFTVTPVRKYDITIS